MNPTGATALVDTLAGLGIDTVFGIPGVHNLAVYEAVRQRADTLRSVLVRHEQTAGFMADGYARVSGDVGVCLVISGPGVTNVLTPLAGAYAESSAVLVIATGLDQPAGQEHGVLHEVRDQLGMASAAAGWARRVTTAEEIPAAVVDAVTSLRTGRPRGAYLEISLSALAQTWSGEIPSVPCQAPSAAIDDQVARAVELLRDAERPLLLAGSGALRSGAADQVRRLAERLQAPVLLGPKSSDLLPTGHPLRQVTPRFHPVPDLDELIESADVLLAIGTKLGEERCSRGRHPITGKLIHIDIDPTEIGRNQVPELGIASDARTVVEALLEAVPEDQRESWAAAALGRTRNALQRRLEAKHGDRLEWLYALRRALPATGYLVADMTMLGYLAAEVFPAEQPGHFLHPYQFCSIGHGFAMALGAKVAAGEEAVVAVCGDGGVLQTFADLVSAVQERIALVTVVFNDQAYSAVRSAQAKHGSEQIFETDLHSPDFVQVARGMGAQACRAERPPELEAAVQQALTHPGPTVIEVPLTRYP